MLDFLASGGNHQGIIDNLENGGFKLSKEMVNKIKSL